ncbi:MAG: hypothetical protein FWH27_07795 [Planctomycetaceae bacterium]|nr:hypothetical protein [Planctomycetaceae bacterium]
MQKSHFISCRVLSIVTVFGLLMVTGLSHAQSQGDIRDLFPDTWVGTDALGRTMPTCDEVGEVKTDQQRIVGIFYVTWHGDQNARLKSPYTADVTRILQNDPDARLDTNHPGWTEAMFHWGEPELGYFLSKDEYVIRKDISMLTDAGVDVLVVDVTNAAMYWDEWDILFTTMQKMKAEGNQVPLFCFWAFNGPCITVVQTLYEKIYLEEKYKEFWFHWDGKPLLLYNGTPTKDSQRIGVVKHPNPHYDPAAKTDTQHPHYGDTEYTEEFYTDYTRAVKDFFTLRTMWWGDYEWNGKRFVGSEDNWSFGYGMNDPRVRAMTPDELISTHNGVREEGVVTPAQHAHFMVGKSWSKKLGSPELNERDMPKSAYVPWLDQTVEHPEGYGIYFQERWDEVLEGRPRFLFVNDWNEWTALKFSDPNNLAWINFMGRGKGAAAYYFVDQYNAEFNRTIQPMKGGYTDNYYMQMAQNIRRYKGVRPIPKHQGITPVDWNRPFDAWETMDGEYRDTIGDVLHRDYPGYGGNHYTDHSGRNDIATCQIAVDDENVYFYVETVDELTPSTDNHWMLLLIDSDCNSKTGWFGYDLLVNQKIVDSEKTVIRQWDNTVGEWKDLAEIPYQTAFNKLVVKVPRSLGNWLGDEIQWDFKWSDNPCDLNDPISLCMSGDTAPNRRFNYRFLWQRDSVK